MKPFFSFPVLKTKKGRKLPVHSSSSLSGVTNPSIESRQQTIPKHELGLKSLGRLQSLCHLIHKSQNSSEQFRLKFKLPVQLCMCHRHVMLC